MKLCFRPEALADLEEIYDYIAADNPVKAGEFIEKVRKLMLFFGEKSA